MKKIQTTINALNHLDSIDHLEGNLNQLGQRIMSGVYLLFLLTSLLLTSCASESPREGLGQEWAESYLKTVLAKEEVGRLPEEGFVPNEDVAIKIAVSVWEPIYGKEDTAEEAPFFAYRVGEYWVVQGTMATEGSEMFGLIEWVAMGGTAKAIIHSKTGEIVHVVHHK